MLRYEKTVSQPSRLGAWEGFGQAEAGAAYLQAIGNAVVGVVDSLSRKKILTTQAKVAGRVAVTQALESTKQLAISTKGATEQAAIGVRNVTATYSSLSNLVVGIGVAAAGLLLAGGVAYRLATK